MACHKQFNLDTFLNPKAEEGRRPEVSKRRDELREMQIMGL